MTATATSWKRVPFVEGARLGYSARFDEPQMHFIRAGLVPKEMEDKWFMYFEEPYLYLHRSWTGQPVFRLTLVPEAGGATVAEALWSMEFAKAAGADPEYQAQLLDFLVSNLLLRQSKDFPRPPNLQEPMPGVYQHSISGTSYKEAPAKARTLRSFLRWPWL